MAWPLADMDRQLKTLAKLAIEHGVNLGIRSIGLGPCPYMLIEWDAFKASFIRDETVDIRTTECENNIYHTASFVIDDQTYDITASEPKEES